MVTSMVRQLWLVSGRWVWGQRYLWSNWLKKDFALTTCRHWLMPIFCGW